MHRVPVVAPAVAVPAGAAGEAPVFRRVPQLNADGTPVLNADGTPAVKRVAVLNPDGTPVMRRVAVTPTPGAAAGAPRVAAGGAASGPTSKPAIGARPTPRPVQTGGAPGAPVRTQIVNDGPLAPGAARSAAPRATPTAPKKHVPEVVPDDGSRPPSSTTAPQPTPPQEQR